MAFGSNSINVMLGLDARDFTQGMSLAEKSVTSFEKSVNKSMKGVLDVFRDIKFPTIGDGLKEAISNFTEFDAAMRNVNSIAQMGEGQFQDFSNAILHLNDTVHSAVGPAEAARAAYDIMSSGFENAADAQKILQVAMVAGTAGMTEAATAAKVITGVINAYNTDASQAQHVSDVLFNTVKYGVVTFEQLATTFGRVAPTAQANGIEVEELSAALATLTIKGIRANEGVTGLKRAITAVAAPTAQAQKTLLEYGLTTDMLTNKLRDDGLVPTLKMLLQATGENKRALRELLGESTAINAAFALAGSTAGNTFDEIHSKIGKAGSTQEAFNEQAKSLKVQIDQLKASLEVAGVTVGSVFAPVLLSAVESSRMLVDSLVNLTTNVGLAGAAFSTWYPEVASFFGLFNPANLHIGEAISMFAELFGGMRSGGGNIEILGGTLNGLKEITLTLFNPLGKLLDLSNKAVKSSEDESKAMTTEIAKRKELLDIIKELEKWKKGGKHGKDSSEISDMYEADIELLKQNRDQANEVVIAAQNKLKAARDASSNDWFNSDAKKEVESAQKEYDAALKAQEEANKKMADAKNEFRKDIDPETGAAEEKQIEKQLAAETKARAEAHKEWKILQDKIQDKEFKSHADELKAVDDFIKKYDAKMAQLRASRTGGFVEPKDEQDEQFEYDISRFRKKKNADKEKEERESNARIFKENQDANKKHLDQEYISHNISLEEYVKHLREMAKEYRDAGEEYKADAEGIEKHIVDVKKAYYKQQQKEAEKHQNELYNIGIKSLEAQQKMGGLSYLKQAGEFAKMAQNQKFTAEQRASLEEKAANSMNNHFEEQRKNDLRNISNKKSVLKEDSKIAEEELGLMKEKAEAGLMTTAGYVEASKKMLALKKKELDADKMLALRSVKGNAEEEAQQKADIEEEFKQKSIQLDREFADQFSKNMDEIKKARGEDVDMIEKQIQKQKEYLDLISNEGKGQIKSLDQFVSEMNTRFGSDNSMEKGPMSAGRAERTSALGSASAKEALRKKLSKQRSAYGQLGLDQSPLNKRVLDGVISPNDFSVEKGHMKDREDFLAKYNKAQLDEIKQTNKILNDIYQTSKGSYRNKSADKVMGDYKNGSVK